ncbi:MAG TPA: hypothetical protein VJH23_00920 [archaeon]|nr:hypothetical protein [archaeon]
MKRSAVRKRITPITDILEIQRRQHSAIQKFPASAPQAMRLLVGSRAKTHNKELKREIDRLVEEIGRNGNITGKQQRSAAIFCWRAINEP